MTEGPISAADLRALLDSTVADPVLELREGRAVVVADDDRGGMEVISRDELVGRIGSGSERELLEQAEVLSAAVGSLGG